VARGAGLRPKAKGLDKPPDPTVRAPVLDPTITRSRRLLERLWSDRTRYEVANLLFGDADNDTAVSLPSMSYIAGARMPACDVRQTACDHLSYFVAPEGLTALARCL
jgi:hypothetical protein